MVKLTDVSSNSLKEKVEKAVAKPKRPRLVQCRYIASSTPEVENKCKELRYREHEEKKDLKTIPVLFMYGDRKRLSEADARWYKSMGSKVEYLSETEVRNLNIK